MDRFKRCPVLSTLDPIAARKMKESSGKLRPIVENISYNETLNLKKSKYYALKVILKVTHLNILFLGKLFKSEIYIA